MQLNISLHGWLLPSPHPIMQKSINTYYTLQLEVGPSKREWAF